MAFRPGQQAQARQLEPTYEDVPPHLQHQLWTWTQLFIGTQVQLNVDRLRAVANHLRIGFDQASGTYGSPESRMWKVLAERFRRTPELQLQAIEYLLDVNTYRPYSERLEEVLRLGNSAYAVREDGKALEMRLDPAVKAQVEGVVAAASGSAGDHLANAWNAAYGRTPDPVKAYSESIKAVEAALAPLVSPQNAKQTLGTMIRDVAAKPAKWKFVIADGNASGVDTVLKMMQMLWDGQTSRHGGLGTTRPETSDEAKAAVHLAASLVQFGVSGAFDVA